MGACRRRGEEKPQDKGSEPAVDGRKDDDARAQVGACCSSTTCHLICSDPPVRVQVASATRIAARPTRRRYVGLHSVGRC